LTVRLFGTSFKPQEVDEKLTSANLLPPAFLPKSQPGRILRQAKKSENNSEIGECAPFPARNRHRTT
jgi:hypothetical protein